MGLRKIVNKQLGEILIEWNVITSRQLEKALAAQKEKGGLIGEILVELGFAKEDDIVQSLTAQYGFPYLPLDSYEIPAEVIKLVPASLARKYMVIPVDKIGNSLTVAMSNPLNIQAIEDVETVSNCSVQTFVSTSSDVRKALDKYYKGKE